MSRCTESVVFVSWQLLPSVARTWNVYVPSAVVGGVLTLRDEVTVAFPAVNGLLPKLDVAPAGSPVSPLPVTTDNVTVQSLPLPFRSTVTVP